MTQEEMLTTLYEKMAAEQDKYRDWLKGQPAAEVLNHAYEYTVREDIVMCMEELELTEAQAKALLASPKPLAACMEAIEQAISRHYSNNRLDAEAAVNDVLEQFGPARVQYVLANTVRHKEWDGRISRDNKAWASTIPMPEDDPQDRHSGYLVVDRCNPGLTDLFLKQVRQLAGEREKPCGRWPWTDMWSVWNCRSFGRWYPCCAGAATT